MPAATVAAVMEAEEDDTLMHDNAPHPPNEATAPSGHYSDQQYNHERLGPATGTYFSSETTGVMHAGTPVTASKDDSGTTHAATNQQLLHRHSTAGPSASTHQGTSSTTSGITGSNSTVTKPPQPREAPRVVAPSRMTTAAVAAAFSHKQRMVQARAANRGPVGGAGRLGAVQGVGASRLGARKVEVSDADVERLWSEDDFEEYGAGRCPVLGREGIGALHGHGGMRQMGPRAAAAPVKHCAAGDRIGAGAEARTAGAAAVLPLDATTPPASKAPPSAPSALAARVHKPTAGVSCAGGHDGMDEDGGLSAIAKFDAEQLEARQQLQPATHATVSASAIQLQQQQQLIQQKFQQQQQLFPQQQRLSSPQMLIQPSEWTIQEGKALRARLDLDHPCNLVPLEEIDKDWADAMMKQLNGQRLAANGVGQQEETAATSSQPADLSGKQMQVAVAVQEQPATLGGEQQQEAAGVGRQPVVLRGEKQQEAAVIRGQPALLGGEKQQVVAEAGHPAVLIAEDAYAEAATMGQLAAIGEPAVPEDEDAALQRWMDAKLAALDLKEQQEKQQTGHPQEQQLVPMTQHLVLMNQQQGCEQNVPMIGGVSSGMLGGMAPKEAPDPNGLTPS